jgi:two-component system response regulator MprA
VQLRRRESTGASGAGARELRFDDLRLDTAGREARRGPRRIALTTTEYELLRLFMQHPREVLPRER